MISNIQRSNVIYLPVSFIIILRPFHIRFDLEAWIWFVSVWLCERFNRSVAAHTTNDIRKLYTNKTIFHRPATSRLIIILLFLTEALYRLH